MFDIYFIILVIPAIILSLWASTKVNLTYKKYSKVYNSKGITGAQAARMVLDRNGLFNVKIEEVKGEMTDHYDPKTNIVRLSEGVYSSSSTAAIGIACHEVGHAIQYAEDYAPAKFRMAIVPVTNIGSRLALPLIFAGIFLSLLAEWTYIFVYIGIACFGLSAIFQLVTLPTEFNASRRAINAIETNEILYDNEIVGTKKVLSAAALTYVAALAVSVMQLLRLVLIFSGGRRD